MPETLPETLPGAQLGTLSHNAIGEAELTHAVVGGRGAGIRNEFSEGLARVWGQVQA